MASRENQGLQIALILFVMMTVVLSVTTFLFFRKYQEEQLKIAAKVNAANEALVKFENEEKTRKKLALLLGPQPIDVETVAPEKVHEVFHDRRKLYGIDLEALNADETEVAKVRDYETNDRYQWGNTMRATAKNLRYSHGSLHEIDSAENWKAGIGVTRQAFHASEVPKWPKTGVKNDNRVMAAVLPSISKGANSLVIAEGTPDGASGWFYNQWQKAYTLEQVEEMVARGTLDVDPAGEVSGGLFGTARCSNLSGRLMEDGALEVTANTGSCSVTLTGRISEGRVSGIAAGWAKTGVHEPQKTFRAEVSSGEPSDPTKAPGRRKKRGP